MKTLRIVSIARMRMVERPKDAYAHEDFVYARMAREIVMHSFASVQALEEVDSAIDSLR